MKTFCIVVICLMFVLSIGALLYAWLMAHPKAMSAGQACPKCGEGKMLYSPRDSSAELFCSDCWYTEPLVFGRTGDIEPPK